MSISWEAQDEVNSIIAKFSSIIPFIVDGLELLLVWEFSSHQQPEQSFWEGLSLADGVGQELLQLRNGVSSHHNSGEWVDGRDILEESLHSSHTSDNLLDGIGSQRLVSDSLLQVG